MAACSTAPRTSSRKWYLGAWKLDPEATTEIWDAAGKLDDYAQLAIRTRAQCSIDIDPRTIRVQYLGSATVTTYKVNYDSDDRVELVESMTDGKERNVRIARIGEGKLRVTLGEGALPEVWERAR